MVPAPVHGCQKCAALAVRTVLTQAPGAVIWVMFAKWAVGTPFGLRVLPDVPSVTEPQAVLHLVLPSREQVLHAFTER